ncbi:hypothetical protein [uncultured Adlercreutzia sp.]|uniref:hypothetical protein n=1 Tax=uncultured Adlercreutzia sp. TaxID=875803 RepID=UPI0025F68BC7|nr:hypothetical protein [uncultured Adlercreutzia sp.]
MSTRKLACETTSGASRTATSRPRADRRHDSLHLPKLGRRGKKALDVIHLLAAAVWLGGYVLIFALLLVQGTGTPLPDPSVLDDLIATARLWAIAPSTFVLMATGLAYGLFTNWGFTRSTWVTVKWILSLAIVGASWHMPLTPTTVSVASAAIALVFVFSVAKPKLGKAKARGRASRS